MLGRNMSMAGETFEVLVEIAEALKVLALDAQERQHVRHIDAEERWAALHRELVDLSEAYPPGDWRIASLEYRIAVMERKYPHLKGGD